MNSRDYTRIINIRWEWHCVVDWQEMNQCLKRHSSWCLAVGLSVTTYVWRPKVTGWDQCLARICTLGVRFRQCGCATITREQRGLARLWGIGITPGRKNNIELVVLTLGYQWKVSHFPCHADGQMGKGTDTLQSWGRKLCHIICGVTYRKLMCLRYSIKPA